ncbi:MAG: 6-phosphogluconolactonase [Lentisphaerae bacterium]|nr:6-phosphogluconolactonase [Lentisphaerota bacterium]MCP4100404.1 6-phosphogluconolactonase [Lentisphaerota bacterium]
MYDGEIFNYKTSESLFEASAEYILRYCQKAVAEKGVFYLAISGGKTPDLLFAELIKEKDSLPLDKIQLFWVDERCVPPDSPESNYGRAKKGLLQNFLLPKSNIHRIKAEESDGELSYIEDLKKLVPLNKSGFPVFDLVVLGVGPDGHTASIFPEKLGLLPEDKVVLRVPPPEIVSPKLQRITLSLETINAAKKKIFIITGSEKAELLDKIKNGQGNHFPASKVTQAKWFVC